MTARPFSRLALLPFSAGDVDVGEAGQCRVRFFGAVIILVVYWLAQATGLWPDLAPALIGITWYLLFSYAWGWVVRSGLGNERARLMVCMTIEHALFASAFAQEESALAPLFWVAISITIGYGLRFGRGYGLASAIVASAMMGAVFVHSPFWRSIPFVSAGMALSILVIPLYAIELNRRVQRAHREAETRAAQQGEARLVDAARHERETAEAAKALIQAELKMLQAQIEPHFLFNTLASVQHLVDADPTLAKYLLVQLNQYLRDAIPTARDTSSTLAREFILVESLLNIVRVRMGGRLTTSIELPDDLRDYPFPPMVLLTLVENAIKHGVEPKVGPVRICVRARSIDCDEPMLDVSVSDDGVGLHAEAKPGTGIGLANIRERLAALFDHRAHLSIRSSLPAGVVATVRVPMEQPLSQPVACR